MEGKQYEQMVLAKLNQELDRTGGLSINKFGFRKGRQIVDAIMEVMKIAKEAADYAPRNRNRSHHVGREKCL